MSYKVYIGRHRIESEKGMFVLKAIDLHKCTSVKIVSVNELYHFNTKQQKISPRKTYTFIQSTNTSYQHVKIFIFTIINNSPPSRKCRDENLINL